MTVKQNVAYDLSRFETSPRKTAPEAQETRQMRVIKTKKQAKQQARVNTLVKMSVIALSLVAVLSIIFTQVAMSQVTFEITQQKTKLSEAQSEKVRLESELGAMVSVKNVEEVATKQLGLTKMDESQIEYVSLNTENKAEINSKNRGFFDKIKLTVGEFQSYIAGIFNNN